MKLTLRRRIRFRSVVLPAYNIDSRRESRRGVGCADRVREGAQLNLATYQIGLILPMD